MKRLIIILVSFLSFYSLKGSPQYPDFLMIGKEKFDIYFLPLDYLDSIKLKQFYKILISNKESKTSSTNLWREYQAIWRLEDNKLYLTGFVDNPNSEKILKAVFGSKYQNGKVLAFWFTSKLAIAKGNVLRWDEFFSRTYLKEEIFNFQNGILKNRRLVDNYIVVKNGISRLKKEQVEDTIANRIQKMNPPKFFFHYWITIDEIGKITDIKFDGSQEFINNKDDSPNHKRWIDLFREQFKDMQFDIIKWNGEPYKEIIFLELF